MFSSLNLNSLLNNHKIFENIGSEKCSKDVEGEKAFQLIHICSGRFFVWEDKRNCLLATNLREALTKGEEKIQILYCQNPPLFQVQSIEFNQSESYVALLGSRGAVVLTLPKRWGKDAEFEGGKEKITCRTSAIAERFFTSNVSIQLLQASWYPNSASPHLCLLTSDNTLRIFNIVSDCNFSIQTHRLNNDANLSIAGSQMSLLSMYSVTSSLGETVVSFAFSNTISYQTTQNLLARKKSQPIKLQPIYLLQGNGDVLLLLTSLTENKFNKGVLHGPLIILPPAEDNYGTDSCSIHVLKTNPSVVVIATTSGRIHHCISLWPQTSLDSSDQLEVAEDQSVLSKSLSLADISVKGEITPPTLYVYETVELDLSLTNDEFQTHFITLHEDQVVSCRYHCCTAVGIHTVAISWLGKIEAFIQADDENKEALADLTRDDHCTVEHVLCTKSTVATNPCFIKGLTIATDPMLGPALICLTDDNHCAALPLLNTFRSSSPPLLSGNGDETLVESPLKKLKEISFDDHIRSLLKRNTSQPIMRSGTIIRENSDKECCQLFSKAAQVLRDEYILKQKLAKDAIVNRVSLLEIQKVEQIAELESLNSIREKLTYAAEEIASDYEDCKERQQSLMERLETVIKRVKTNDPVLSKAEIEMGRELKNLSEKLRRVDNGIKQLKVKQEYQTKKLANTDNEKGDMVDQSRNITKKSLHIDQFKQILLEEGEKISDLIKKLNNMNLQVGL